MVRMQLDDIAVSGESNQFLLLLRSEDDRMLPIVVDAMQALAIAAGRSGEKSERPLTHDLVLSLLEVLGAEVNQVEITDLSEGTFYAMLSVERGGVRFDVDARPSDALAVAVRTGAPIYVAEHVLEDSGLSDDTETQGGFEA
ncbi:MAG: bifunctional nuclease family protein [Trueperaceae bacterium]|nr:bifunctional nuclease family protein [Trueperaceae bacterium]